MGTEMTVTMLIIIMIIVIPGYLLMNRFAKKLFWGNEKLERETENRYGFKKLEEELKREGDQETKNKSKRSVK